MALFLLIFFLLLTGYCLVINYYRNAWNSIPEAILQEPAEVKVSVVVAVRNEEKNIGTLLSCLAVQDYPGHLYEVIIVDDHSSDNTVGVAKASRSVKLLQLPRHLEGKKQAISMGVSEASGELIVTTDGDCHMHPEWLMTIVSFYRASGAKFIAAPVTIERTRSLVGIFQALDFITLQGITGAAVYRKFHTMCNGANLAFPRTAFFEVNGFEGIDNIPSGDDMLLMHKIFVRYPDKVLYLKAREAIVTTEAEMSWKDFFQQRIRWASKTVHYKDKRIFYVLLLTYLVNICFLICAVLIFLSPLASGFFILLLVAKVIIEYPFVNAVAIFFNRRQLMTYFILLQPVHILYVIIAGWAGRFGSYTWKSRKIKNSGRQKPLMV
jgi:cellulose synthase/poly-beta-1,6-N-acetylglucosamine synthase-like glycosyltransferase